MLVNTIFITNKCVKKNYIIMQIRLITCTIFKWNSTPFNSKLNHQNRVLIVLKTKKLLTFQNCAGAGLATLGMALKDYNSVFIF
jgi:hypothetical protein